MFILNIITSAVKRLIAINRIHNKVFVYIIYVCVLCIYKYTHMHVYISENMLCLYINYMNVNLYM